MFSILLTCLFFLGCFSTIEPEKNEPAGGPGPGSGVAAVRGKVLLYRGPGDFEDLVTGVQIKWLDAFGVEIGEDTVRSNHKGEIGNYYASTTDHRVKYVKVAALKCDYDSNDPAPRYTCCLDPEPCPGGCVSPWDTSYRLSVVLGATATRELRVACGGD
jgi:hypothetical protein